MLKKIAVRNFKTYRKFDLEFLPDLNILVGDNDAGKSTLLEAIGLALTMRINGRSFQTELSPFHFNAEATQAYIAGVTSGTNPSPPELVIDVFLDPNGAPAGLKGTNNLDGTDDPGIRVLARLNPDYALEYAEFIKDPAKVTMVPTEYYEIKWLGFSGNPITFRSIPAVASLIDASNIRLASGADFYLQGIIHHHLSDSERVELSRSYRSLRETFTANPAIQAINTKLSGTPGDVSDRELSLSIDVSSRAGWEANLVPHLDDLPFTNVGKGEQSRLKILLALNRKVADAHIVLIEEPENHLSHTNLNILVGKIAEKCAGKQVFITTHSSYVLNKLGLGKLVLLSPTAAMRLDNLPPDTLDYFKKLSGYDTLRVVLAKAVILVEGPSDELIVQRAYRDVHGKPPIEAGVDVINVRGLSFRRFLDIAMPLNTTARVVTDNDGKDPAVVEATFNAYSAAASISVHVGKDRALTTLEPQLLHANGRARLNTIFGKTCATDAEMLTYMTANKTSCAVALFETSETVVMPEYISDAVA